MTLSLPNYQQQSYRPTFKSKSSEDMVFWSAIGLFSILLISMYLFPAHAYDAYVDIIDNVRFEGNIREIEWLVQIFDKGIIWIISFIGFFIISSAMLRNVLSGCYAAFPRLFDMLAETKEQFKNSKDQQGGMLKYVISFVIPNIKPLTDFADGTASPRGYFTKSILLGVVTVIIGVCIYNGLYRDLIREGAQLGTHVISNYILRIDFTREFDKIMETGRMYKFIWANSKADGDKSRQKIAKAVYMKAIDMHGDVRTTESRRQVGSTVEQKLMTFFETGESSVGMDNIEVDKGNMADYFDSTSWDCIIEVNDSSAPNGRSGKTGDPNFKYFMCYWTVAELTGIDGELGAATGMDQQFIYAFITFRRNDLSDGTGPNGSGSKFNDGATATVSIFGFPTGDAKGGEWNMAKAEGDTSKDVLSQSGHYSNGSKIIKVSINGINLVVDGVWDKDTATKSSAGLWSMDNSKQSFLTLADLVSGSWTVLPTTSEGGMVNYGGYTTVSTFDFKMVGSASATTLKCTVEVSGGKKPGEGSASSGSSSGNASSSKAEE